ncbi:hypothetical protein [Ottowia sp.]|nr:hypothetical protein [Ottowia sp.]
MLADEDQLQTLIVGNDLRHFMNILGTPRKIEVERAMGTSSRSQLVD